MRSDICRNMDSYCCCSPLWHVPPSCAIQYGEKYDNSKNVPVYDPNKEAFFTVVRNPYIRLLSEYWYVIGANGKNRKKSYLSHPGNDQHKQKGNDSRWFGFCDRKELNAWIRFMFDENGNLKTKGHSFGYSDSACHLVPQWRFTDLINGSRLVAHILHTEHLQQEFNELMSYIILRFV